MNTKMYVGNLPFRASEAEVRDLFSQFGAVTDVHLPMDREMGRPRGFAFVTMGDAAGMNSAIQGLHGKDWNGRALTVNEARPREDRPSFGGGGGGGGYGGGGGGGRREGGGGGGRREGGGGYGGGGRRERDGGGGGGGRW